METLHTVLKHGAMDSDWTAFPRAIFAERLAAARKAIAEAGDEAWIVYGDCQHYGELAYLTHFLPRLRSSLALITLDRDPIVLTCVGSRDIPAMQVLTWVTDIRPYWRLPENMPQFIAETGLTNARIGLVGVRESMPIGDWEAIRAALPGVTWSFRDDAFARLRRPDEVTANAIRHAGSVVREGLRLAPGFFKDRPTLRAACAEIERVVRRLAAEDVRILAGGGGAHGRELRPPDETLIDAAQAIPLFLACEVQRCWAEAATTLHLNGSHSPAEAGLAQSAERALNAMLETLAPQARAGDVWSAAMATLEPPLRESASIYGLGHGIGLDALEAPEIAPGENATFEPCAGVALHVVLRTATGAAATGTTLVRAGERFVP